MKKAFLTVVVAVGTFALASAQEIKFEKMEHDFGTLKQDAPCQVDFKFTNTGKAPLILAEAKPSCGCTTPEFPKEPIAPGKSAKITVKYDSHRVGPFDKTVTVKSNALQGGETVIKIKGTIDAVPTDNSGDKKTIELGK
ncbi:MAG: DUF1573 domain-containing protein [Bacteroidia bacterium]|nr:DUF1573 domain-containing protein [Bacteroidia bacterium]